MTGDRASRRRAQSGLVGIVILYGVIILASVAVVVAGGVALETSQTTASMDSAAMSMSEVDGTISSLVTDPHTAQAVTVEGIGSSQGDVRVEQEGEFRVVVTDNETGTEVVNETTTLGRIVYENDGRMVAYQGGGVYRGTEDGSSVVSPPAVDYATRGDQATLTVPLVSLSGETSSGDLAVTHQGSESLVAGVEQPLSADHRVEFSTTSRYYRAWGQAFERQLGQRAVTYDHDAQSISVTVNTSRNGGIETVGGGTVVSDGPTKVTNDGTIDSYDSASGNYGSSSSDQAGVHLLEAREFSANAHVGGDLHVAEMVGDKRFTNSVEVEGDTAIGDSPGGPVEVTGGYSGHAQHFRGTFSTKDHLVAGRYANFHDRLIVGGTLERFAGHADGGSVYVHGSSATISDEADIEGDLIVAGDVTFEDTDYHPASDANVDGTVIYGGTLSGADNVDAGGLEHDPSRANDLLAGNGTTDPVAPDYRSVEGDIESTGDAFANWNDNANSSDVTSDNYTTCHASGGGDSSCTLTAGRYYLEELHPQHGDDVVFDTSSGDVQVYVENNVLFDGSTSVEVQGDNRVRVYVGGNGGATKTLKMTGPNVGPRTQVSIPDDNASQFVVYMKPGQSAQFDRYSMFTGVLYGPGDASTDGVDVRTTNYVDLYGGLVGNLSQVSRFSGIHVDERLNDHPVTSRERADAVDAGTFVHVSTTKVGVED